MDQYQYPLFFEARDLTDRENGKIWRFFQKRKDSGGGDCAMIEKVGGKIYKVSFKEKEDQERVLQRKFHTISLPAGELRLTVSRTDSAQTPDQPSTSQSQTSKKTNTKCLEKIFELDIFLMYYLRDNPKAYKVLQKQLSLINCTVELDFDEEEAVVRGDVDKGSGGAFGVVAEKWELQVDQIFISITESYLCYHVVEPKKVKKLLQDRQYVTDDMRVYHESGYSVVVGQVEAVNEKIAILEKSLPTRREVPVVENHLKLVKEEFSREMRADCPEVRITRASAMIILEGADEMVQSGAAKLNELIKKIKEKRLNLATDLLTFMKTSGAISKYDARFKQTFRNPVSLDIGSDLLLSSLSSVSLDEAEVMLLRDLRVVIVPLQGAAAGPPDVNSLKEVLNKAKNEANRGELRVDVSFIPGPSGPPVTTVQLVGYTEHVTKLKEVLHDYQMNQVSAQETLNLMHPELVDSFDEILRLLGMKQTNVTLKASHFPHPCVLLSGPRCHVQETHQALISALSSLTLDTLVLDGPGAMRLFQGNGRDSKKLVESSCHVLIREQQDVLSQSVKTKPQHISSIPSGPSTDRPRLSSVGSTAISKINLNIKLSSLEDEQVDVLVAPMLKKQLESTKLGKDLLRKGGSTVKSTFDMTASISTLAPGDVMPIVASASLSCSRIFFIECSPWDGVRGNSVQALGKGLKKCLELCVQQGFTSVAIPVIGPGIVLKYPLKEAIRLLKDAVCEFGLSSPGGSLSTIHIIIKPGYPDSVECYHEMKKHLISNMNQGGQAIFRPLTSDLDDITMTAGGGVKVELIFGDITNETTDAVVNTTDFVDFQNDGVCKDILTVAGPRVEAKLKAANVNRGQIFVTGAGSFPCEAILHVCGQKDASVIEGLVCSIIDHCENSQLESVAIPAICSGTGGLDPGVVAGAILRGIKAATSSKLFHNLTNIRLVLIKIDVFLAFKEEAMQMFANARTGVSVPPMPLAPQHSPQPLRADLSILQTSSTSQKSTFLFWGLSKKDVDDAMVKLKNLYKTQCSTQTFKKENLESLSQDDMMDLKQLAETSGLYMQQDPSGNLTVDGLNDGVNQAIGMINAAVQGNLRRKMAVKEEDDLYSRVAWCILGQNGHWERLSKAASYKLETRDIAGGIVDVQGVLWTVDRQRMEATANLQQTKLKRLENLADFTFPLYWDSMAIGETMKVVALQPSSAEYRTVKEAFKRTAKKTVMKIERLQNIHLRRAYEAQKKLISEKNTRDGGASEKFLYHGTTLENSDSIMKTGFNRRFAGQNGTAYGLGTYFAVNASYSAAPTYSSPGPDGSQLMFVARVLTGVYTQGQSGMNVPPPRDNLQSHSRYDSVVDKMDNPGMYVVFHDDQAYADYLITFK
ncbi:protein mono-ADP-ribosyltransferase PARP14-like [Cololabis saira]|uniref:protein mono-ADP-ribosyltransferase PARP14-like n=1 Tax=Cololabis saira TaxID=129043 RepID=UPI002AD3E8C2|nr:protein mono-ADP-ribosyltransferase PARP14-like [Cololabis saira]